jgi:predicted O-methyltransferase YrrM
MIEELVEIRKAAFSIPGFRTEPQAEELMQLCFNLDADAIIVEIGAYMGLSAALFAGTRRLRGSGVVHCVDSFDCSGDDYSVPHYQGMLRDIGGGSLRQHFNENIARLGLQDWVRVHQGKQEEIAADWQKPIDLLLLDGDQSPIGARSAYENWAPFLKTDGVLVVPNSAPREYEPSHGGQFLLVQQEVTPEKFRDIRLVERMTVARKR